MMQHYLTPTSKFKMGDAVEYTPLRMEYPLGIVVGINGLENTIHIHWDATACTGGCRGTRTWESRDKINYSTWSGAGSLLHLLDGVI